MSSYLQLCHLQYPQNRNLSLVQRSVADETEETDDGGVRLTVS